MGINHAEQGHVHDFQLKEGLWSQLRISNDLARFDTLRIERATTTIGLKIYSLATSDGFHDSLAPGPLAYHQAQSMLHQAGGVGIHAGRGRRTCRSYGQALRCGAGPHVVDTRPLEVEGKPSSRLDGLVKPLVDLVTSYMEAAREEDLLTRHK